MEHLGLAALAHRDIARALREAETDVAGEVGAELVDLAQAVEMIGDHQLAAQLDEGRPAEGQVEIDLLDQRARRLQLEGRRAAQALDLGIDADLGDVRAIGDAQPALDAGARCGDEVAALDRHDQRR